MEKTGQYYTVVVYTYNVRDPPLGHTRFENVNGLRGIDFIK